MNPEREESYGLRPLSPVDRFGVWLSLRAIRRAVRFCSNIEALDLGCGYRATHLVALMPFLKRGMGVDFEVAPGVKSLPGFSFQECSVESALPLIRDERFDLVLMISVLEHIADPGDVLRKVKTLLKPGGILLINVPTWTGKLFLEFSAFRMGWSPKVEMDDHKMYYSKRDLWPLIVQAGFRPSQIRLCYHKFGLNLFANVTNGDF